MKKSLQVLLAFAAFGLSGLALHAQSAPKIAVVDMAKLYDTHYKTEEQKAKLRTDEQKAQEELDRLNKEGTALVEQYKELVDQSNNPAATAEAKAKAQDDAKKKMEEIQKKQNERDSFRANTQRSLQQRMKTFNDLLLEEIGKVASDVAKRKGATLLLDKSGPSLIGVPNVVYADASYDITEDVAKEINKDRPANSSSSSSAPASSAATPNSDGPQITVPGVTPKK